ncbi:DUF5954 family protein [Actinomadura fibrosa]|uniref:DUF5954 family protein n=1 Tax=Actinomadura fibrosa TaxID=111802 RepID=A0ABW2XEG7_9ACTN|nr:DUF5954 family protein [Actinomadura fibrosa]
MSFPLMRGHDKINVVPDLDPVAAARDAELGERMRAHPKIFPAGSPDFGFAVQTGPEWRIDVAGEADPEGGRGVLASTFRQYSEEPARPPKIRRAMRAAADRLDPEEGTPLAKDEWEIGDRRYRVIRIEKFTLIGGGVMEPPRVTDTDPPQDARYLHGHLVDPLVPTGHWETQLRLNLIGFLPIPGTVPEQIEIEARQAIRTHPGVVLLPPSFTVMEIKGDSWESLTAADGPTQARHDLAAYFTKILPRLREFRGDPPSAAELNDWTEAAAQIESMPGPEFSVLDRRFRIVRISRFMRVGVDGPEAPRPSDQDRYGFNC